MAGPTVTLTFAGDEDKLTRAMRNVGESAETMGKRVDSTSDSFKTTGRSAEDFADKTDTAETRAMGFADTLDGVKTAFDTLQDPSASFGEKLINLGRAAADVAGGLTNFVIPAVSGLWKRIMATTAATYVMTAAQTAWAVVTKAVTAATAALNAVMRANPILFIVGLIATLVTAFIVLWNKSAGFRQFFINMWNGIRNTVSAVVSWIKNAWNNLVNWFRGIPGAIGRALGSLGSIISNVFKGAVNIIIDALNWGIDRINDLIYAANVVSPFDDIPYIPHIGRLHTGGVVPGMLGSEQLMMLQAGERVVPRGQGNDAVRIVAGPGADGKVAELVNYLVRTGQIQAVRA